MNVLNLCYLSLLLLAFVGSGRAQSSAQLTLSQANVDAGDKVSANLTLDTPAACDTTVRVNFYLRNANGGVQEQFVMDGQVRKGDTSVNLTTSVARDRQGGIYHSEQGVLFPCPGYENAKIFKVPDVTVTVRAIPDPNVYPTRADLVLSVTQKQFFDTKIAQLSKLELQLTTRIEGKAADLPELRVFLAQIVESAERDLTITEGEYREQILKSKETPLPAFFADFHVQYQTLLVQLKAPIPGLAHANNVNHAKLIYVQQLKKRSPTGANTTLQTLAGTYPSSAKDVRGTISDNKSAYRIVKETGRITFDATLSSYPVGAHILYKKLVDDSYSDYSGLTNVEKASFELATWNFKFHKEGCTDEPVWQLNPYEDTLRQVYVEFVNCRRR